MADRKGGVEVRLLDIYLDDHWGGAAAGKALARRLARENASNEWGPELRRVADQIAEDDRTLGLVRASLGVRSGGAKRVMGALAERMSVLKLNGRLVDYSPLSRVVESEALVAGITAKRMMWGALGVARPEDQRLDPFDFEELEHRADGQIDVLRRFHEVASVEAFAGD